MILLDTCAMIWDALDPGELTSDAANAINDTDSGLIICDISLWEIAMLIKKDRLSINGTASEFLQLVLRARNYRVQEITPSIADLSVNLGPEINSDPADRLISATSILLQAPLVTADKNLRDASLVETIW